MRIAYIKKKIGQLYSTWEMSLSTCPKSIIYDGKSFHHIKMNKDRQHSAFVGFIQQKKIEKNMLLSNDIDQIYLTEVFTMILEANCFFPKINFDNWEIVFRQFHKADLKNIYDYEFIKLVKKCKLKLK